MNRGSQTHTHAYVAFDQETTVVIVCCNTKHHCCLTTLYRVQSEYGAIALCKLFPKGSRSQTTTYCHLITVCYIAALLLRNFQENNGRTTRTDGTDCGVLCLFPQNVKSIPKLQKQNLPSFKVEGVGFFFFLLLFFFLMMEGLRSTAEELKHTHLQCDAEILLT